jgi:hypothetical protein
MWRSVGPQPAIVARCGLSSRERRRPVATAPAPISASATTLEPIATYSELVGAL